MNGVTLGVIVGNRGFFPDHLCETGRQTILKVLAEEGINAVALTPQDTKSGSIESLADAQKCADLFKQHREEISGVLVTLPKLRRRARGVQCAALGRTERARAGGTLSPTIRPKWTSPTAVTRSAARCRPATTCASMASSTL